MSVIRDSQQLTDSQNNRNVAHPQRHTDLIYRDIEGETVILHREAGVLHKLNATAAFVWNCCDGTLSIDDIAARLTETYDIDAATSRKDAEEIITQFKSLKLLTNREF